MIEFFEEYWWLSICVLFLLVPVIYNEATFKKKDDAGEYKSGAILGLLLLSGLVTPQIYYNDLIESFSEAIVTAVYFFYLGVLLILSYYYPKKTFFLRMMSALTLLWIWPKTDKGNLYSGALLILISPLALALK